MPSADDPAPFHDVLSSAERRLVYTDWLLERGDPRGSLLAGARLLGDATTARDRAAARLEIVAALKRVATWLDEVLPEGKPWRSSDVRGVRSELVGFLSHQDGVLHRLRVPGGAFVSPRLFEVIPTLTELAVAHDARAVVPVSEVIAEKAYAGISCLDLELPAFLNRTAQRPESPFGLRRLSAPRTKPLEVRLSEGVVDERTLAEALQVWAGASMLWLDRARVEPSNEALSSRPGLIPHLRLTESNLDLRIARDLALCRAFSGLERLEVKDWPIGAPSLEEVLRGASQLRHVAVIRSPLGSDLPHILRSTGTLERLTSLDASGCLLSRAGVRSLLEHLGPATKRLTVRFNQLVEADLHAFAKLPTWPRGCEVVFEETSFGTSAHQALAELARAHQLSIDVKGCVWTLKS